MDDAILEFDAVRKRMESFESNFKKCSKANRTKGYLKGMLTGLEELWKSMCEVDAKMESLKTQENENESYFEDSQFERMEEKYFQLKGEIQDHLEAFNPQPQVILNQNANGNRNNAQNDQSKVKLPQNFTSNLWRIVPHVAFV